MRGRVSELDSSLCELAKENSELKELVEGLRAVEGI